MKFKGKLSLLLALVMLISAFGMGAFADTTYTVKAGDKLWKIAKSYGVDYKALAEYNKIKDYNRLVIGQKLMIPDTKATVAVKPVTPAKPATPATPAVPAKPATPAVPATPSENSAIKSPVELVIMHTNDMHGFFVEGSSDGMGAAKLMTAVKDLRAKNLNTLLIDAGDAIQGSSFVNLFKGEKATGIMNVMEYDAMAVGNHEFDFGSEQLLKVSKMMNFPMLAANVKKDGKPFLGEYKIFERGGVKVGVFGLTTPETVYKSHPDNTKGILIDDIYKTAAEMVKVLKAQKVDVIIATAHLGEEGDFTSMSLVEKVKGIDVLIDGHSHSTYETGKLVADTLIVSAGEKTKNLGVVNLVVTKNGIESKTARLITKADSANIKEDIGMKELVDLIGKNNNLILNEVVANSPVKLVGDRAVVRAGESNLGNMITEALLDISKADVALTNGGGIRTSIDAGPVTKGEVLSVLPFGNTVRVIELTGADLTAAIEHGVAGHPTAEGKFPHIAGMTVKFDNKKAAGSRVVEIKVAGQAIVPTKTYKLATNDFLVAGGDGYTMFKGKKVVAEFGTMDQVLTDYMNKVGFGKAVLDGRMKEINTVATLLIKLFAA